MMKPSIALLLSLFVAWGCSKEEFAGTPRSEKFVANSVEVFQNLTCANSTLIKPPVDILYVVDNSLSSGYLSSTVKEQLQLTIQAVSQQFDYRIMVAPLLPDGNSDTFRQVITNNAAAMSSSVNVVSLENLAFFSTPTGINSEAGMSRSVNLINSNRIANGGLVFRNNAHTIVVLVSNEDDDTMYQCFQGQCTENNGAFDAAKASFINLRNGLNAQQLRFFSVVAHTNGCQTGFAQGKKYREMSAYMYANASIPPQSQPTDQGSRTHKDSYDLCSTNFGVYEGVNSSIQQEILGHTYNYWLLSENTVVDTTDIQVSKLSTSGSATSVPASATNGWSYAGFLTNRNTRRLPTPGEPRTGYFLQLNGSAEVTYPDCLVVRTRTPTEFYGFAVAPSQPRPDTIIVRIRGSNIPQSTTNGWSYEGYRENQNIKVNANGTVNTTSPLNRTGYFIKLNGSAIYASGDTIEIFYTPAGI